MIKFTKKCNGIEGQVSLLISLILRIEIKEDNNHGKKNEVHGR